MGDAIRRQHDGAYTISFNQVGHVSQEAFRSLVAAAHKRATGMAVKSWLPAAQGSGVGKYSPKGKPQAPDEAAVGAPCASRGADPAGDSGSPEEREESFLGLRDEAESGQVMLHIGQSFGHQTLVLNQAVPVIYVWDQTTDISNRNVMFSQGTCLRCPTMTMTMTMIPTRRRSLAFCGLLQQDSGSEPRATSRKPTCTGWCASPLLALCSFSFAFAYVRILMQEWLGS